VLEGRNERIFMIPGCVDKLCCLKGGWALGGEGKNEGKRLFRAGAKKEKAARSQTARISERRDGKKKQREKKRQ